MNLPKSIEALLSAINDDGTVRAIVNNGVNKNDNSITSLICFIGEDNLITLKSNAEQIRDTIPNGEEDAYNSRIITGAWVCEVIAMWCEEQGKVNWAKKIRAVSTNKVRDIIVQWELPTP